MPLVPIDCLRRQPVHHIVSLGCACEVAFNLRRFYSFATAYPFDWWISSPHGVADLIGSADIDALYDDRMLHLSANAEAVKNSRFDISLHHEFSRDWKSPGHPVITPFYPSIAAAKKRTFFLFDRLLSLDKKDTRIAFIRMSSSSDEGYTERNSIIDALSYRFNKSLFTLIYVNGRFSTDEVDSVVNITFENEKYFGWKGNPARWDAGLHSLGLQLQPGIHRTVTEMDLRAQHAATMMPL